ncbi:hypothetical protein MKW92_002005, partial [Papaver armeniacum]
MGFKPLVWYCKPVENGIWSKLVQNAFGVYTPCGMDTLVISFTHLVLLSLCIYRIWKMTMDFTVQRFRLRSNYYNYFLGLLAAYCAVEPIVRLMLSLVIEAFAWWSMLVMIYLETKIYIREFRDAVMVNLVLSVKEYQNVSILYLYSSEVFCQYQALHGEEQICPERHVNVFSKISFAWMTPLMEQGFRKPITEKDVSRLLVKGISKSKPWLLRALNSSLGGSYIESFIKGESGASLDWLHLCLFNFWSEWYESISHSLGVLSEAQYFQNVMRVGYRLRSTLVAAIFRKSLKLTHEAPNMSTAPQFVVSTISNHRCYGSSTFVINKMKKLTKEGLQRTDKRIGLMNEILAAMDTVKYYAWEWSFKSKVQSVRDDELSWFRKSQLLSALNRFILNSVPVAVTVISFGMYTLLGGVVNANVSLKRLEELFLAEERLLLPNPPLEPGLPAISIKNGNFSWDSKAEKPTLSNINLNIPVGSLVAVVGSTGEGKTSLISAMLGELPPTTDADVVVRGTIAYVPQVSWIFNATVRDNILFGSPFEASRYEKAIDMTAMQHDLNILP